MGASDRKQRSGETRGGEHRVRWSAEGVADDCNLLVKEGCKVVSSERGLRACRWLAEERGKDRKQLPRVRTVVMDFGLIVVYLGSSHRGGERCKEGLVGREV